MQEINFTLTNINVVAEKLQLKQFACPVIVVTGTNGKGSTVAALEAIYTAAGYRVATFTSPCFYSQVEQIRLQQQSVSLAIFNQAIKFIEDNDDQNVLTEFESLTLAALFIFKQMEPQLIILEVGMGGHHDAVNVVDNDLAIITNVELDHQQWLGDTREQIAAEKAGILRAGKAAIYGEERPPQSLVDYADQFDCDLCCLRTDPDNNHVMIAREAVKRLHDSLPVTEDHIAAGLENIHLPGRMQVVKRKPQIILDVGHNPAAARFIAARLQHTRSQFANTFAVFSMLDDKDIAGVIAAMKETIDHWYIAQLKASRAAPIKTLIETMQAQEVNHVTITKAICDATQMALQQVGINDRIIVFGSFYTVAESELLAV